jgi:hypothetical protein
VSAPPPKRQGLDGFRIPGTSIEGGRAVLVSVVALYMILFVALNTGRVQINFVFFKARANILLGLIVIAALGFVVGFIVRGRREVAQRSTTVVAHAGPARETGGADQQEPKALASSPSAAAEHAGSTEATRGDGL